MRERERQRQKEKQPLRGAGSPVRDWIPEPQDYDLIRRQPLNPLNPGTLSISWATLGAKVLALDIGVLNRSIKPNVLPHSTPFQTP